MKIRIGYLGMPHTLCEKVHTMTHQKYQKLGNKQEIELEKIILENLKTFEKVIDYNYQNKVFFYRMTHNLFPLATIENITYNYSKFKDIGIKIGNKIKKYNLRVDAHPDHYLVLNTEKDKVLENSIRILTNHLEIFNLLGIDGKVILHIGSIQPTKEEAIKRFAKNFLNLKPEIQKMILLENDDKTYTVTDTLKLCQSLNIPMVLDYHHFKCNHLKNENIKSLLPQIFATWKDCNLKPKIHMSSSKSQKEKRAHHFYIDYHSFLKSIELLKPLQQDVDIMLESKGKDEALFKLLRQLKFYKPYKIKQNSIITLD